MKRCPTCGTALHYDPDSCPQCLRPLTHDANVSGIRRRESTETADPMPDEPLHSIARFTNAAEAGFFAHTLLYAEDIPATIRAEDSFDAISGYWSTRYHLEVPERLAESASRTLQSLIDRSESEDFVDALTSRNPAWSEYADGSTGVVTYRREAAGEASGIRWGPIMITLAAGSLAFLGFRAIQTANKPRAAVPAGRNKGLWGELSQPGKPWVQRLEGNRRREMNFNHDRTRAVIREYNGEEKVSEREYPVPSAK